MRVGCAGLRADVDEGSVDAARTAADCADDGGPTGDPSKLAARFPPNGWTKWEGKLHPVYVLPDPSDVRVYTVPESAVNVCIV